MENKSPHDPNFEKFVRQSLQKVDGTPDENTWEGIAARQSGRNFWLRFRHYGMYIAPVVAVLVVAIAGWKYFASNTASQEVAPHEIQQQTAPSHQPQADVFKPEGGDPVAENTQAKEAREKSRAAHLQNNLPVTRVRFAAEEGLRYENPATGTSVYIPANTLVTTDGKPVHGEVEFDLREYRSIPDFLASDIPMHYTDERGTFFFNSGGMFDLRVKQHGQPLQMAAGQSCDVRFTSTHKLTQPSLYYFDETDNAWKYQPDPAFTTSELPPVVTDATVVRDNRGVQMECLPSEYISYQGIIQSKPSYNEPTVWVQDGIATGYDYAFGKTTMPGWFRKHPDWTNEQLLNGLERSTIRMKRHKDTDDMFFPEDINNVFTELKAFKDCYFIVNDGLGGKKSFTSEEFDSYWDRVSVVQQNGALCYISFFGKQGLLQFYATLVGSMENKNFDAEKVLVEYTNLRNQRQHNFDKIANAWRHFCVTAQMFQQPEEWCMDAPQWFDYFDANLPLMRKRYADLKNQGIADNKELALNTWSNWEKRLRDIQLDNYNNKRSFNRNLGRPEGLAYALRVTNFGTYNCDQIYNLWWAGKKVDFMLAAYKSADGHRVVPKKVCAIEKSTMRYLTMREADQIVNMPGRKIDVVVTDYKGRFYRLKGEEYASLELKDQKSHTFTIEDVTEKVKTPRDWAELLEI